MTEVSIAWVDFTYKVNKCILGKEKVILNKLNGFIEFGTINALMGPSGAGKTTLLKCLYGKLRSGIDSNSKIFLNSNHEIKSCFVSQHSTEHIILCLTAKQNLIYASKLKNSDLGSEFRPIDHQANVELIMDELMIRTIPDTPVGKCSGGEQKRLSIAAEMTRIVKPNLLCIDEPTTGLDSNIAEIVMNCLNKLTKTHNISVITSIHQPNNEIVLMFDKIYVLAKGGDCVFSGDPHLIRWYLYNNNIVVDQNQVPIEQMLKSASIEPNSPSSSELGELITKARQKLRKEVLTEKMSQLKLSYSGFGSDSKSFKIMDFYNLLMRTMSVQYIKQWKALFMQFLVYNLFAYFISNMFNQDIARPNGCFNQHILFNQTCLKDLEDNTLLIQNQNFLFIMILLIQCLHICYNTMAYLQDVKIFISEHDNGWYSTGSFFFAKNFVEIIPSLFLSVSYAFLSYYWSGQPFERFRVINFMIVFILGFLCTEGIGNNIGISLVHQPNIGLFISITIFLVLCLFANFYILIKDLPVIFQYFSDYSHLKYVFNSALIVIYGLNRCAPEEESVIFLKYGVEDNQLYPNIYKLALMAIVFKLLAYFMLKLKTITLFNIFRKRNKVEFGEKIEIEPDNSIIIQVHSDRRRSSRRISLFLSESQPEFGKYHLENIPDDVLGENKIQTIDETLDKKQICIAWSQLTIKISKNTFQDEKVILKDLNGFFQFGTINALMGSSGAGKTILLKCINGLINDYLTDESKIFFNKYQKIRSFIDQDERQHVLPGLTAGQSVLYASKLKNFDPEFDHKKNVAKLMEEFLISNTKNTNVEDCSGGEQKRLVLAMELTSRVKPNLICIDEPTSGLDSNAAEVVMNCLKRLTERHNICVITSIHQPNSEIFMLFNKVYVLAKGGLCLYSGRPQNIPEYLEEWGILYEKEQVPIEILVKYSCIGNGDEQVQRMITKTRQLEISLMKIKCQDETLQLMDGHKRLSKRFFIKDFRTLLIRALTLTYRHKWKMISMEFLIYITFALCLQVFYGIDIGIPTGCIDLEDDHNNTCAKTEQKLTEETLREYNLKYTLYVVIIILSLNLILSTMTFSQELKVFINEQRNGWYSTGAYYWSKSIVDVIPVLINIFVYSYVADIYSRSMFTSYFIYLSMGALIIQSIGHTIGIIFSSNQRLAVFTSVGVFIFSFMFSNFIIQTKDLHYSLQVLSYLSPIKLILESIYLLYYGFGLCSDREFSFVLYFYDIEDKDLYKNTILLIIQFFLFRVIVLVSLFLKVRPLRNSKNKSNELFKKWRTLSKRFKKPVASENYL